MRVKALSINNYRCFRQYDLSLAETLTVLIGKNGSGKTSLICALKAGMSFIFSRNRIDHEQELISSTPDLRVASFSKTDAFFDSDKRIYQYPISVSCTAIGIDYGASQTELSWALVKNTANGKLLDTKFRNAFLKLTQHYNSNVKQSPLPLLAYFSDSYPHKKAKLNKYAESALKSGRFPRSFAYYQWDAEYNCAEIWQNRYISQYSKVSDYKNTREETRSEQAEIEFIDQRIKTFTKPLRNEMPFINSEFEVEKITLERPTKQLVNIQFQFADGRKILFEHLPQGYNRLISIVFDIAYRSYILNGSLEPKGIVCIDEIELHLHPSLQQEVLQRFTKTFPELQFIVSSHSPLVISNLKADGVKNRLIRLENIGDHFYNSLLDNVYGLEYATNLSEVMGCSPRQSTVDKLVSFYLVLHSQHKFDEAAKVLSRLEQYLGGRLPEAIRKEIEARTKSLL